MRIFEITVKLMGESQIPFKDISGRLMLPVHETKFMVQVEGKEEGHYAEYSPGDVANQLHSLIKYADHLNQNLKNLTKPEGRECYQVGKAE